ncbi:MAG: PadR family transcriptional regulator, partial [Bacillota bacterium]
GTFILTEATLYTAFKRLEAKKWIESYWKESDSGKKRKYYTITHAGKEALLKQKEAWSHAKTIIDTLL